MKHKLLLEQSDIEHSDTCLGSSCPFCGCCMHCADDCGCEGCPDDLCGCLMFEDNCRARALFASSVLDGLEFQSEEARDLTLRVAQRLVERFTIDKARAMIEQVRSGVR